MALVFVWLSEVPIRPSFACFSGANVLFLRCKPKQNSVSPQPVSERKDVQGITSLFVNAGGTRFAEVPFDRRTLLRRRPPCVLWTCRHLLPNRLVHSPLIWRPSRLFRAHFCGSFLTPQQAGIGRALQPILHGPRACTSPNPRRKFSPLAKVDEVKLLLPIGSISL